MRAVFLCLGTLSILMGLSMTPYPTQWRHYWEAKIEPTDSSEIELAYRQCLHRVAGDVGVTSLKQMQRCQEETGYVKL